MIFYEFPFTVIRNREHINQIKYSVLICSNNPVIGTPDDEGNLVELSRIVVTTATSSVVEIKYTSEIVELDPSTTTIKQIK